MQTPKPVSVRSLLILLSVLLSACTFETVNEAPDASELDPMRTEQQKNAWGQSKVYGPAFQNGAPNIVTFLPATELQFPEVCTANLGIEYLDPFFDLNGFRWLLKVGVGGAQRSWKIDALPMQQVSLPCQSLEVSLIAEPFQIGATFVDPGVRVRASAFIARGNTSTSSANYTQGFALAAVGNPDASILIPYPAGAVGFRLVGYAPGTVASPIFVAGVDVKLVAGGGAATLAWYQADDLLPLFSSDGYIPLPGGADALLVSNTTVLGVSGAVQWELDL